MPRPRRTQRATGPSKPLDVPGSDARGAAHVRLEPLGAASDVRAYRHGPAVPVVRVAALPRREALCHRLESLPGPLVGIRDDPLLARRERGPAAEPLAVREPRDGVVRDRPAELRVTLPRQP